MRIRDNGTCEAWKTRLLISVSGGAVETTSLLRELFGRLGPSFLAAAGVHDLKGDKAAGPLFSGAHLLWAD